MIKGFKGFLTATARSTTLPRMTSPSTTRRSWSIIAATIYFVVLVPMRTLETRFKEADADTPAPSDEAVLLTEIRDLLREQGRP